MISLFSGFSLTLKIQALQWDNKIQISFQLKAETGDLWVKYFFHNLFTNVFSTGVLEIATQASFLANLSVTCVSLLSGRPVLWLFTPHLGKLHCLIT